MTSVCSHQSASFDLITVIIVNESVNNTNQSLTIFHQSECLDNQETMNSGENEIILQGR